MISKIELFLDLFSNLLKRPSIVFRYSILKGNCGTWNRAYWPVPTIPHSSINIPKVKFFETFVQWRITLEQKKICIPDDINHET